MTDKPAEEGPVGAKLTECRCGGLHPLSPARVAADRGRTERRAADENASRRAQEAAVTVESAEPVPAATLERQGDAESREGVALIAAERQRQIDAEGYAPEHDAKHADESLALAACSYAIPATWRRMRRSGSPVLTPSWGTEQTEYELAPTTWPWEPRFWKPTPDDRVRELVKAGALIAAEIDRLVSR